MFIRDDKVKYKFEDFSITYLCSKKLIDIDQKSNGDLMMFLNDSLFWSGIMIPDDLSGVKETIIKKINHLIVQIDAVEFDKKVDEKAETYTKFIKTQDLPFSHQIKKIATKSFKTPQMHITYSIYYS